MWFHIPKSIFKQLGGIELLLKWDFEINKIPIILSKFHQQIPQSWKMIFNHNFTPHGSTLWNNRTALINRKTVFKQDWFDKKILYVKDMLNDEGKLLTYASFTNKYQLSCTLKDFNKICRAIPSALIHLIRNTLLISHNVVISLPKLQIAEFNVSDFKLTNKILNNCFKERIYHVHNRASFRLFSHLESQNTLVKAQSM